MGASGAHDATAAASSAAATLRDSGTAAAQRTSLRASAAAVGQAINAMLTTSKFKSRLRKKQLRALKKSKKLEDLVRRLWRDAVADKVRSECAWTLAQYMDYHLSLYCYLEELDGEDYGDGEEAMLESAWEVRELPPHTQAPLGHPTQALDTGRHPSQPVCLRTLNSAERCRPTRDAHSRHSRTGRMTPKAARVLTSSRFMTPSSN